MIRGRSLARGEIPAVWTIDRSELIEAFYFLEDGALALRSEREEVDGWPPGEAEKYTPLLEACHDRGGWFHGLFAGERLVGAAVLDARWIGRQRDQLQLAFLHVGHSHRGRGLGRDLFRLAAEEARRRGAKALYVSATPSQHTIDFYLRQGCRVAAEPDPELLELEPYDIHLECLLMDKTTCGP